MVGVGSGDGRCGMGVAVGSGVGLGGMGVAVGSGVGLGGRGGELPGAKAPAGPRETELAGVGGEAGGVVGAGEGHAVGDGVDAPVPDKRCSAVVEERREAEYAHARASIRKRCR